MIKTQSGVKWTGPHIPDAAEHRGYKPVRQRLHEVPGQPTIPPEPGAALRGPSDRLLLHFILISSGCAWSPPDRSK
jgi:hypothetical protein